MDALKQTALVSRGSANTNEGPLAKLKLVVPDVVANVTRELKAKSVKVKTRIGIYQLLKELVHVYPGVLAEHVGVILPGVVSALSVR